MLTVITPTGERPFAFGLCQKMMARQTYRGPIRWIIVDDGEKSSDVTIRRKNIDIEVIRPTPFWKPGENTQGRNLNHALSALEELKAKDEDPIVTVWEDDDWYSPDWLSHLVRQSADAELVGEGQAIYYNVRSRRYSRLRNYHHASLRCSAMRCGALDTFRKVLGRYSQYYDFDLWKAHENKRVFFSDLTVGIKGMPGRPGIAVGHDVDRGVIDHEMRILREWIGKDADWYAKFYEVKQMTEQKQTKQMRALVDFKYGERGIIHRGDIFFLRSNSEEALFMNCGRAVPAVDLDQFQASNVKPDEEQPRRRGRPSFKSRNQEEKLASVIEAKEEGSKDEKNQDPFGIDENIISE